MVKEKTSGKLYALKCLKKKHLAHTNLENEINVLRRYKATLESAESGGRVLLL